MDGTMDLGVSPIHRPSNSLNYVTLYDETMTLFCGEGHPLFTASEEEMPNETAMGQFKYAGFGFNSPNMIAGQSLGLHWGTFPLSLEDDVEPAMELARQRTAAGLSHREFYTAELGETMEIRPGEKQNGDTDLATKNPDALLRYVALDVNARGDDRDILKWLFRPTRKGKEVIEGANDTANRR